MSAELTVCELSADRASCLAPLIQSHRPQADLNGLMRQLAAHLREDADAGVLAIQNAQSHVIGLFTFAIVRDVIDGLFLIVPNVIAMDVMGRYGTMPRLVEEIDALARRRNCRGLQINLEGTRLDDRGSDRLAECFERIGCSIDGVFARKSIQD